MAQKVDPRLCEYEVKKLRSPACSGQENAILPPYIHKTWGPPFRPFLYYPTFLRTSMKLECFFSLLDTGRRPLFPPDPRILERRAFLVGSFAKSEGRTEADTEIWIENMQC